MTAVITHGGLGPVLEEHFVLLRNQKPRRNSKKSSKFGNVPYWTANFVDQVRGNKHDWEGHSACRFVSNALIEKSASSLTFCDALAATKWSTKKGIQKEKLLTQKYFSLTLFVL